jgi:hypothetical protein
VAQRAKQLTPANQHGMQHASFNCHHT